MKPISSLFLAAMLSTSVAQAKDTFLSHPELLGHDPGLGEDLTYLIEDYQIRLPNFDKVMVDEPVLFISPDSPYGGFKASDLAALSQKMRESVVEGLQSEPVSIGTYKVVEQPGEGTLYLRFALKNIYIRKNKRSLFAYTPVGAAVKGVKDVASEAIDKSTLVELTLEAEVLDSVSGELLFAVSANRGQRKDKHADIKEDAAGWEMTGVISTIMGRRLACRLDNARLEEANRRDCVKEIPVP